MKNETQLKNILNNLKDLEERLLGLSISNFDAGFELGEIIEELDNYRSIEQ